MEWWIAYHRTSVCSCKELYDVAKQRKCVKIKNVFCRCMKLLLMYGKVEYFSNKFYDQPERGWWIIKPMQTAIYRIIIEWKFFFYQSMTMCSHKMEKFKPMNMNSDTLNYGWYPDTCINRCSCLLRLICFACDTGVSFISVLSTRDCWHVINWIGNIEKINQERCKNVSVLIMKSQPYFHMYWKTIY